MEKAGVVFLVLVGVAASCSCYFPKPTSVICGRSSRSYIISAKIIEYVNAIEEKAKEDKLPDWLFNPLDELATTTPPTTYNMWREIKVRARITKIYKGEHIGKGAVGTYIELRSGTMGSMCGWSYGLVPGRELVFATNNLKSAQIDLCDFKIDVDRSNFQLVEQVLEHHDCGCKAAECRVREGRRVLKGPCHAPAAYCERDEDGQCWWRGASIEDCRKRGNFYALWD